MLSDYNAMWIIIYPCSVVRPINWHNAKRESYCYFDKCESALL